MKYKGGILNEEKETKEDMAGHTYGTDDSVRAGGGCCAAVPYAGSGSGGEFLLQLEYDLHMGAEGQAFSQYIIYTGQI